MEVTSLCITQVINVLVLLSAQVQHSYSHRADGTFPRIVPSRLQLFEYESVFINCEGFFNDLIEWRVMRKIKGTTTICNNHWEATGPCNIKAAYSADSGEYWCEAGGKKSNTVNIIVTAGSVILESPGLPVMEGEAVTLICRSKMMSSNFTADFYKDGLLIMSSSTGNMTINSVSKSDEGLYKCSISGSGESAESWLPVRGGDVVLESPALPVMEQQDVTLRCRKKADKSSKLSADFFRDGQGIGTGFTMTIYNISRSHEGRYKCRIPGTGESAENWLTVTEDFTPAFQVTTPQEAQQTPRLPHYSGSSQLSIRLMVAFIALSLAVLLMVLGLLQCWKHRVACFSSKMPTTGSEAGCEEANFVEDPNDVTYTAVIIKKKKQAPEDAKVPDADKTTYAVIALQREERADSPAVSDLEDTSHTSSTLKDEGETPSAVY